MTRGEYISSIMSAGQPLTFDPEILFEEGDNVKIEVVVVRRNGSLIDTWELGSGWGGVNLPDPVAGDYVFSAVTDLLRDVPAHTLTVA